MAGKKDSIITIPKLSRVEKVKTETEEVDRLFKKYQRAISTNWNIYVMQDQISSELNVYSSEDPTPPNAKARCEFMLEVRIKKWELAKDQRKGKCTRSQRNKNAPKVNDKQDYKKKPGKNKQKMIVK